MDCTHSPSASSCPRGCKGYVNLFMSLPLDAKANGSVLHGKRAIWLRTPVEMRGTTIVFFHPRTYNVNPPHFQQRHLIAVLLLDRYRFDIVKKNDVVRIYFSALSSYATIEHAFVQPAHDQVDQWCTALAAARAANIITFKDIVLHGIIGVGKSGTVYAVSLQHQDTLSDITYESDTPDDQHESHDAYEYDSDGLYALKVRWRSQVVATCTTVRYAAEERLILEKVRGHRYLSGLSFAFQTDTYVCHATPLCPGGDLICYMTSKPFIPTRHAFWHTKCCRRFFARRRLTDEAVQRVAAQVVVAMQYLHKQGILYRALTLENILIDAKGNIKLGDFSLSRYLVNRHFESDAAPGTNQWYDEIVDAEREIASRQLTICGADPYMATEMFSGKYSYPVDLFAFGVVLYRLRVGLLPFRGGSYPRTKELENRSLNHVGFPCSCTKPFISLVLSLLKQDPSARPGWEEIRKHEFFQGIDWKGVENGTAPPALEDVPDMLAKGPQLDGIRLIVEKERFEIINRSMTMDLCSQLKASPRSCLHVMPGFEFAFSQSRPVQLPIVSKERLREIALQRPWTVWSMLPYLPRLFLEEPIAKLEEAGEITILAIY